MERFVADARALFLSRALAIKARNPARELMARADVFNDLRRRFAEWPPRLLGERQQRFRRVEEMLRVLGPDATLRRGYSITTDATGNVIRTTAAARPKMKIRTRVSDGEFESTVRGD
jgi:exodeoxyribonuclease VII large subunit